MPQIRSHSVAEIAFLVFCSAAMLRAQAPTAPAGMTSRAVELPESGRTSQPGAVASSQSPSGAQGADTITSSVQVSGDFRGSVPGPVPATGSIQLSLADAVKRGLETNLGAISAANSVSLARAETIQSRSALLPNISVSAAETVTQIDLAAYGLQINLPPQYGVSIPTVVGPFAYSQLQGNLSQSIFDLVQMRNLRASKESQRAFTLSAKDARELVVLAVAGTYMQTVTAASRVASQQAQVANAEAIYNQAVVRKQAGTNAKIDVMRSLVELETQRQRLSSLVSDLRKQKIALARLIGLPLDRELVLTDTLAAQDITLPDTNQAIQRAFEKRSDLRAAEAQVRAAEFALSAAHAERLPSASLSGDYGVIGPNPTSMHGVFAAVTSVNVPVWEGGRIKGDIAQAEATLRQRRSELANERGRVEQEVRNALIELETASGQVRLAASNRDYANETLAEARDRFSAGVATTVEVVQAEEQVASAESDYVASVFSLNLAKLSLARATGEAEADVPNLLGSAPAKP